MKKTILLDDYNQTIHAGADVIGSVTQTFGHSALRNGWKLIFSLPHGFRKANVSELPPTLTGSGYERNNLVLDMAKHYRIRKLTPREAFRLMGVSDDDISKIKNAGICDSQQYKLAWNSIVVQVLEGIFTQMFRKDDDALF